MERLLAGSALVVVPCCSCSYNYTSSPVGLTFWFPAKAHPLPSSRSYCNKSGASEASAEVLYGQDLPRDALLKKLDQYLSSGNEREALTLMELSSVFKGFGAASQVPQRIYSISDLRLNDIDTTAFLSPNDTTLGAVRRNLQLAAILGSTVLWQTLHPSQFQVLLAFLALLFISGLDLVINNGGMESLVLDTLGRILSQKYKNRVAQHEAGHFLIAYLLGVLPKSYTLSSLDAYLKEGSLNVQAGTTFVDVQFQDEVKSGKLTSMTLNKFTCIALAGVSTEYLVYGLAEGGLADIQQLDNLLKSLNFTQMKADSQVRWAVLNTVTILRRHKNLIQKVASAMFSKKTIGECIEIIETELDQAKEI